MNDVLKDFLKMKITRNQLKEKYGDDLHNVEIENKEIVYANDVVFLINQYLLKNITLSSLLEWVNTVWFTDLYEYYQPEENVIAHIMSLLESLDEDDVEFSSEDFTKMINLLKTNNIDDI